MYVKYWTMKFIIGILKKLVAAIAGVGLLVLIALAVKPLIISALLVLAVFALLAIVAFVA